MHITNIIIVTFITIILLCYIAFLIFNRNQLIINDTGFIKSVLFSFGILTYFINNLFINYTNYTLCSLNFIFKYIGLSIIISIYCINFSCAIELGKRNNNMMKYNFSLNVKAEEGEFESIKSEKRISNESLNHYLPFNSEKDNIDNPKYNKNNMFDEILNTDLNNEMKSCKKLKLIHSLLIEIIFINLLFILIVFIIPILYKLTYKENLISIVQDNNMLWVYKCKLEELDFFLSMIYFIFVIILLIIANTISKYECIFSYIIYIKYSLYVLIAFGPTINVSIFFFLKKKKKLIYFFFLFK